MKLKILFSAMLTLGFMSSVAMADNAANTENQQLNSNVMTMPTQSGLYGVSPVWNLVIDRNADNAYGEVALYKGQTEVTGEIITDFKYRDYTKGYANSASQAQFSLYDAQLYVDSQFNEWIRAHIAVDYNYDFTSSTAYQYTTGKVSKDMFFPEAYVSLYGNGHFYAKIGRQYVNFGSSKHDSLSTPLAQSMALVNATAVTAGVVDILGGLYFDASVFNGNPYGQPGSTTASNSAVQANGYVLDLGYTDQMANQGYNVYVDYVNNYADTLALNYGGVTGVNPFNGTYPTAQVGGIAAHADYHIGQFIVMGNYVSALSEFNPNQWAYNGAGAKPSAYGSEFDYNFMTLNHASVLVLGYEGTTQSAGYVPVGTSLPVPQTRFLVGYNYSVMKNVYLEAEYDNDQDYSGTDVTSISGNKVSFPGTGGNDNALTLRLKVLF